MCMSNLGSPSKNSSNIVNFYLVGTNNFLNAP